MIQRVVEECQTTETQIPVEEENFKTRRAKIKKARELSRTGWHNVTVVLVVSLTAWPTAYIYNWIANCLLEKQQNPVWLMVMGVGIITVVAGFIFIFTKGVHDWFFYGFAVMPFTCMIDLMIGLELDEVISGFFDIYFQAGEPYLNSPYGAYICYWDGTGNFIMYILMVYAISVGRSYRNLALYWSAGVLHSLLILLIGALTGKSGPHWCTMLNIPYVVFSLLVLLHFLKTESPRSQIQLDRVLWWIDPAVAIFLTFLLFSVVMAVIRGLAALDSSMNCIHWYLYEVEPVILQTSPAPFARIQALVYFFYFLPIYLASIYGLLSPGHSWMPDLAILHGGAALQAQVSYIGMTLHKKMPWIFSLPQKANNAAVYWIINIALLCGPQLLIIWCLYFPEFFNQEYKTKIAIERRKKAC